MLAVETPCAAATLGSATTELQQTAAVRRIERSVEEALKLGCSA
jgi:hypothetical protein